METTPESSRAELFQESVLYTGLQLVELGQPLGQCPAEKFCDPDAPPPPKVKTLLFLCFYLGQRSVTVYKALGVFQRHSTRIPSLHKLSRT